MRTLLLSGATDTFVMDAAAGENLDLAAFKHYLVGFDGLSRAGDHVEISLGAGYYNYHRRSDYTGFPTVTQTSPMLNFFVSTAMPALTP